MEIISSNYLSISKAVWHLPNAVLNHKPDGYLRPSIPQTSFETKPEAGEGREQRLGPSSATPLLNAAK